MAPTTPWTADAVLAGLRGFYHEIAGIGLMFPSASHPIAVEYHGGHFDGHDREHSPPVDGRKATAAASHAPWSGRHRRAAWTVLARGPVSQRRKSLERWLMATAD